MDEVLRISLEERFPDEKAFLIADIDRLKKKSTF